ncbi:MAG TPA: glycosyltransferase family 2 protein [Longimicrobiales bacterium]|nr:glycosyltransferase family 2 protein [Longimicrobiales bacterium]
MTTKRERRDSTAEPYFSICIPQYNRTSFLIAALRSFERQDFRSFEICISDDVSNDGREDEVVRELENCGIPYCYVRQATNLRYDGNLRAAISLARGTYCLLMGNDDGLSDAGALRRLAELLHKHRQPGVAVANYRDAESGAVYQRTTGTKIVEGNPASAIDNFRNFSFVSGVLIRRDLAHRNATIHLDGSEMYQVYLVTRAMAEGENLLQIDDVMIDKDLRIPGESVDSYAAKPKLDPCPIEPRKFNLVQFPRVVSDAISASVPAESIDEYNTRILDQLYSYTYPYWLVEFRRVQSWKYALGIALGQRPAEMTRGLKLSKLGAVRIRVKYTLSTLAGLLVPVRFTQKVVAPLMYRRAKRS